MDQSQGNQYHNGQNYGPQNYSQGHTQNDPFKSFIHDDDGAFDNTWQAPEFPSNQQPPSSNEYDTNAQHWRQPPYQPHDTTYLSMPQYNVDSRYQDPGSNFPYPGFDSNPPQGFSATQGLQQAAYPETGGFNNDSLSDGPPYQYSQPHDLEHANQTISPAAITSYPDLNQSSFSASSDGRPSQKFSGNLSNSPGAGLHGGEHSKSPMPLNIQEWRLLANRAVKSIDRPGLHIKPTNQFASVTQTKRFDGFIFVGNSSIAIDSSKANIPRYKRKKSRNEAMRLLQIEKGDGPWHTDREHLVKRLKTAAKKQGGPRPVTPSTQRKGSPSSSESSDSESDGSSEYGSESEPEKEPEEPSPLSSARPADPNKAVEYDIVKAVWAPRASALSGPVIRTALAEAWDILKGVRDKWKSKSTNLQQAIDKKDKATEKAFERRVAEQRQLFEICNTLLLKHGHPNIIEKLSENPVMLVVFYQFLADRIKIGEHTGILISSILELMARCPNIDASLLEKTKIDKLLPRILKRGDDQGKKFTQKVLENAKLADKKPDTQINGTAKKPASSTSAEDVKHEKSGPSKRSFIDLAARGVNGTTATKSKVSTNDSKMVAKTKSEPSVDAKTKVVNVAAKPSGFFSTLKSASKRPGTSTKLEDSSSSAQEKKIDAVPMVQRPAFSFAATMAGLAKQKEEPQRIEEARKPETEAERQKRVRKESRRGNRVKFKADDELVSIRTFEHDPEEEVGHDQSQVRDVGDSKGEGQMLKMHKDLELDDEEDYEPPEEIGTILAWTTPQPIDFNVMDDVVDEGRPRPIGYMRRGGALVPESPERNAQIERENGSLMAIYASAGDVPPTPREPTDPQPHPGARTPSMTSFGEPLELTLEREAQHRARKAAQPQAEAPPTPDISALLSVINKTKQQAPNPVQAQPQPRQPANAANPLTALFANLLPNQNSQTHEQQPPQLPFPNFNLQAAMASTQQPQQNYQSQPAYNAPPPNPVPNLQTILSQIGIQTPAPQPAPPMQNYGYNANQSGYPVNEDRKRQIESDDNEHGRKRARGGRPFTGVPHLPCKFWQEGKCRKGDDCTFLHEST